MLRTGAESTGFCCKGFEWKSDTDSAILNRKHVTGEMVLFLNPSHFKSNYKMDVSSAALWRSTACYLYCKIQTRALFIWCLTVCFLYERRKC